MYCTCLKFQCSDLCSSSFKLSPLEISSTPKSTITHSCITDSIADPIPFFKTLSNIFWVTTGHVHLYVLLPFCFTMSYFIIVMVSNQQFFSHKNTTLMVWNQGWHLWDDKFILILVILFSKCICKLNFS